MFRHEPHLQLVAPHDIAHQQIVRAIVAGRGSAARHRAGFLEHDLMRVQQP